MTRSSSPGTATSVRRTPTRAASRPVAASRAVVAQRPGAADANAAWSVLSTIIAGIAFWGGVGFLADHWLDRTPLFGPIGVLLGMIAAIYLVVIKTGNTS